MRKLLALIALSGSFFLQSQSNNTITKGDILVLGESAGFTYESIDFPRRNIILKRGAIADFKSLEGKYLIVNSVETTSTGVVFATLSRKDGQNFFRFFPEVTANISKALELGELSAL